MLCRIYASIWNYEQSHRWRCTGIKGFWNPPNETGQWSPLGEDLLRKSDTILNWKWTNDSGLGFGRQKTFSLRWPISNLGRGKHCPSKEYEVWEEHNMQEKVRRKGDRRFLLPAKSWLYLYEGNWSGWFDYRAHTYSSYFLCWKMQ